MFNFGLSEIFVIVILAIVVLGPKRLPDVIRRIAMTYRELHKAGNDLKETLEGAMSESPNPSEEKDSCEKLRK